MSIWYICCLLAAIWIGLVFWLEAQEEEKSQLESDQEWAAHQAQLDAERLRRRGVVSEMARVR